MVAVSTLNLAAVQAPSLGRIVLVKDGKLINGQTEHAAIVTQVHGGAPYFMINVMVMPGFGEPYPLYSAQHESAPSPSGYSWRWPDRV